MNKIYLIFLFFGCLLCAFVCGRQTANAECRMQIAQELQHQAEQSVGNKRILNDKVYKTGVADIRRILQSEYSIAE